MEGRREGKEGESRDEWLAPDKLQHLLACLLITLLVSATLSRTRYRFLRRWSVTIGSVTALAAGAAKEAGDEIGLWESAGGSVKDAVADLLGGPHSDFSGQTSGSTSSRKGQDHKPELEAEREDLKSWWFHPGRTSQWKFKLSLGKRDCMSSQSRRNLQAMSNHLRLSQKCNPVSLLLGGSGRLWAWNHMQLVKAQMIPDMVKSVKEMDIVD